MTDFTWDKDNPLARNPGETRKANDALLDYWAMGSGRSLAKVDKKYTDATPETRPTSNLRTLKGWSTKYKWQARVDQTKALRDAEDEQIKSEWRRQVLIEDHDLGGELRDLALAILGEGPKYLKTTRRQVKGARETIVDKDGKTRIVQLEPDREIITVALDGHLMVRVAKLASELQRQSAGIDRKGQERLNIDLSTLSVDQLTRLAAGEDLIDVLITASSESGTGAAQSPDSDADRGPDGLPGRSRRLC